MFCQRVSVSQSRSEPKGTSGQAILSRRKCIPKKVVGIICWGDEVTAPDPGAAALAWSDQIAGVNRTALNRTSQGAKRRQERDHVFATADSIPKYPAQAMSSAQPYPAAP